MAGNEPQIVSVLSNPYATPTQRNAIVKYQQQQALAQALQQQGLSPLDTNNRSIGGVSYKISPYEGLNKIAQALLGTYGQKSALSDLNGSINSPPSASQSGGTVGDQMPNAPVPQDLPSDKMGGFSPSNAQALAQAMRGPPQPSQAGQLPPALQNIGLRNPEILDKAQADAYFGDHRAGATYRDINGNVAQAPTDHMQDFGASMPQYVQKETMLPGQQAAQSAAGTAYAGSLPVGQLAGMAGVGGGGNIPPPPPASAFSNMPAPNAAPVAPVSSSALQPPGIQISGNAPPENPQAAPQQPASAPPGIDPNMTAAQNTAALDAWKATDIAKEAVKPAGDKTASEDAGKNLADAQKTYNVAASNLPRAMQRFGQLRQAAQDASYGGGIDEEDPGSHFSDYSRNFARTSLGSAIEPKVATANQIMDQATKQGILTELGPQLQGLKGNKFLEGIASGASGLNLADPPDVKVNAINGLQDQYISNLKSVAEQRRQYGDPTAPTDMDLANMIAKNADPSVKVSVVAPDGKLGRISPTHLPDLIRSGGQLR